MDGGPKGASVQTSAPPELTPSQKNQWNAFVDYMDKSGYKGSQLLDDKDKNLGQFMFDKFKQTTPGITLTYMDVPRVQQDLQNYRNNLVTQYKAGKIAPDESIKSEDDIMAGLSPVDGWLGSKTSSHKFPVAMATSNVNGNVTTKNYGTNVSQFDADRKLNKK